MATQILKIDQATFIRDLIIKKGLTDYNTNVILMKTGSSLKIIKLDDYKEAELCLYQHFISKLIYLAYGTRLEIVFVVGQLSRHNINLKKVICKP